MSTPKVSQINNIHRIDLPRVVLVGPGVLNSLGEICRELGYHRALVVSGRITYKVAAKHALEILSEKHVECSHVYAEDAQMDTVGSVVEDVNSREADVVVGVGGGRSIDVAKLSAAKTSKGFISVPTVASHDGIASSLASIKGMGRPYTVRAVSPIAVIMDGEVIAASPYKFTASGCGDVISKATEVEDWKLAHKDNGEYYGAYAGSLALMSSQLVMESASRIRLNTPEMVRELLEALVSCGVSMSIAGSSRPCSGSAHLFSHALDLLVERPALHGEQCGVGAIMMANLHGLNWEAIRDSLSKIGAPTNAKDLGFPREKIIEALVQAKDIRTDRYTILSKANLDIAKAESLAKRTGVI